MSTKILGWSSATIRPAAVLSACLLLTMMLAACGNGANQSFDLDAGGEYDRDFSTVNGSITVGRDAQVRGSLSTVNGGIRVASGASIQDAETVNGSIRLEDGITTRMLTTVNGNVRMGEDNTVEGDINTVNGAVGIGRNSRVEGNVQNFNGSITVEGGTVAGNISTSSGDVRIMDGARVTGDIHIQPRRRGDVQRDVRVVIGQGSVVEGELRIERQVELYVHEDAEVGSISGADPTSFSGSEPPRR